MPVVYNSSLTSPFWLPDGHFQSIFPSLFRKIAVNYVRERITTPDQDFLDLDWSKASQSQNSKLVILSHGLEGDSSGQYIRGMVRLLNENNFDALAWNYRGCGEEMNLQPRFYHSGETTDLQLVIDHALTKNYTEIYLMGFSLGGNVTLKYLSEQSKNIHKAIKKAVVFSVPMDLAECSRNINKLENWPYNFRFIKTLKQKVLVKSKVFPETLKTENLKKTKTVWDFDDYYTAPIHGFKDAEDYYARCSAKFSVQDIAIPTLIVNAINDPLVPYKSLPIEAIEKMSNVILELSKEGGHCGFRPSKIPENGAYWSEERALRFLISEF